MNLFSLVPLPYRLLALAVMSLALVGFGWVKGAQHGEAKLDAYKSAQQAEILVATNKAYAKLQTQVTANQKVTNDYLAQKKIAAVAVAANTASVQRLEAALRTSSGDDAAALGGADDPRNRIIDSCAAALVGMDEYARGVAQKATSLQSYASSVCLVK